MKYVSLDSDEKILSFISSLNPSSPIAVDLEGEFNLHIYGEHLCLIQIFDGKDFYIIDPRSKAVSEKAVTTIQAPDGTSSNPLTKKRAKEKFFCPSLLLKFQINTLILRSQNEVLLGLLQGHLKSNPSHRSSHL